MSEETLYTTLTEKLQESYHIAALLWSLIGLFVGLLLCISAIKTLISNEQLAVRHAKSLAECEKVVISIEPDFEDAELNESQLVHLSGEVTTEEILREPLFDVNVINVLKLRRRVEMYQWVEHQSTDEYGTLDVFYAKKWSETLIDSKQFKRPKKHQNPIYMPLKTQLVITNQAKLGYLSLSTSLINRMNHFQPLPMKEYSIWQLEQNLTPQIGTKKIHLIDGSYYIGQNPNRPRIGDLRIRFAQVLPKTISVIAKQERSQLLPYQTQTNQHIELLEYGTMTAEQMFFKQKIYRFLQSLPDRIIGLLFIFIGFYSIFSVSWVLNASIPLLGNATELKGWLTSLLLATMFTLALIAVFWLDDSPMTGRLLIVIVILMLYFFKWIPKPLPQATLIQEPQVPKKQQPS
jgi:hypothetical protein